MENDYLKARDELQETLLRLMREDVPCEEALIAMADLTTQIALANCKCEDVAKSLILRMGKHIEAWNLEHVVDGDLNRIC